MSILKIIKQDDKQDWQKTGFYLNLRQGLLKYNVLPPFLFEDSGTILSFKAQEIKEADGEIVILSETDLSLALLTQENGKIYKNESPNNFIEVGTYQYSISTSLQACKSEPFYVNSFTEIVPDPLQATFNKTDETSLNANNGTITIVASDGVSPYLYSINNGLTYQSSGNFFNVSPGTYDCIAKDVENSQVTQQLTISEFIIPLSATFEKTNETSAGLDDGTITITASGGALPYEYSKDGGLNYQASNVFTNLAPDSYNCRVRDANLDVDTDVLTIDDGAVVPVFSASVKTHNAILSSGVGGSIIVSSVYSPGVAPFEYSKDGGSIWQSDSVFTDLADGSYDIVVRDSNLDISDTYNVVLSTINAGSPIIDDNMAPANWGVDVSVGGSYTSYASGGIVTIDNSVGTDPNTFVVLSKANALAAYYGQSKKIAVLLEFELVSKSATFLPLWNIGGDGFSISDFTPDSFQTNKTILMNEGSSKNIQAIPGSEDVSLEWFEGSDNISTFRLKRFRLYLYN